MHLQPFFISDGYTDNAIITLYKHDVELQRTDPGTKVMGEFSTRDRIFPPNAQNGF